MAICHHRAAKVPFALLGLELGLFVAPISGGLVPDGPIVGGGQKARINGGGLRVVITAGRG